MKLTPLADRVVLKMTEPEETTKGGIILTGSAKEKPSVAEVISVVPKHQVLSSTAGLSHSPYFPVWIISSQTFPLSAFIFSPISVNILQVRSSLYLNYKFTFRHSQSFSIKIIHKNAYLKLCRSYKSGV